MTRHWGRFRRTGATPWFRRTGATPWMVAHRSQSLSPPSLQPPADLVDARRSLAVCVVCGHDETDGTGRVRITCPDCGSSAWRTRLADAETKRRARSRTSRTQPRRPVSASDQQREILVSDRHM
jgi:predicted RNA-binding Zn-ribbon protein involved in translation (DUF1610 family)